jgi:hypothetical protein
MMPSFVWNSAEGPTRCIDGRGIVAVASKDNLFIICEDIKDVLPVRRLKNRTHTLESSRLVCAFTVQVVCYVIFY